MTIKYPSIYFCNRYPNINGKLIIHTNQCPHLAKESDRFYIGISPKPSFALFRAEKMFFPKSFALCPKCCKEAEFDKNS